MSIDVLSYELKYKNDPMVMELLRAYKEKGCEFSELEEAMDDYQDSSSTLAELKETVDDVKQEVSDTVDYLINTYAGQIPGDDFSDQLKEIKEFLGRLS